MLSAWNWKRAIGKNGGDHKSTVYNERTSGIGRTLVGVWRYVLELNSEDIPEQFKANDRQRF